MEPQTSLDELVRTQTEQALRKFVREYLGENEELSMRHPRIFIAGIALAAGGGLGH